jgi:pimeloyl-ACP methyl ester carboxylesterase
MRKLFLPGYGTSGRSYARGLGAGWYALEPPPFRATNGAFAEYERWLARELRRTDEPVWLAGHSMGGALAVVAAAAAPERVVRLTLISPAGLPLRKPMAASLALFAKQVALGRYELGTTRSDVAAAIRAPRAALRLAHAVRNLDLSRQMRRLRQLGVPALVVGCASDTLVTPRHCRVTADLLGAEYRELELPGGHMWMLESWPRLAQLL